MTDLPPLPPGYVAISMADLAELLSTRGSRPPVPEAEPPSPAADRASWEALSATVAMLTAQVTDTSISHADVIGQQPSGAILDCALLLAAATLRTLLPDQGEGLLRSLGLAAASATTGTADNPGGTK